MSQGILLLSSPEPADYILKFRHAVSLQQLRPNEVAEYVWADTSLSLLDGFKQAVQKHMVLGVAQVCSELSSQFLLYSSLLEKPSNLWGSHIAIV